MKIPLFSTQSINLTILFFVALMVNGVLYSRYGVKIVNDSARYLEYANSLKNGFFFDPHNFWYFTYVFFIYVIQLFSIHTGYLVLAQCILSILAMVALYKASLNIYCDHTSAFISALCYILYIEIPSWNFYILPESFYGSMLCIVIYVLTIPGDRSLTKSGNFVPEILVVLFVFLTKPTGIVLLISYGIYLFAWNYKYIQGNYSRIIGGVIFTGLFFLSLLLVNRMLYTFILIENYQKGEIVYGITTLYDYQYYGQLTLSADKPLYIPEVNKEPLIRLIEFTIYNPLFFAKMICLKIFYNLMNVRPYWSVVHNIFSGLFLGLSYYFFVSGFHAIRAISVKVWVIAYIFLHVLVMGLTTVDWDGRFLIPVLPVLFLVSGRGVVKKFRPSLL